ncbi:MAG: hypothetical protein L0Y44_05505 [Phycisphaerales bacterium]|nr:hypothetical protein [Phycisphaerales bacterium]MCI0677221.1 hypothetical protein [Phycisphaerales bacterium]
MKSIAFSTRPIICVTLIGWLCPLAAAPGAVIRIDPDSTTNGPGNLWSNAYQNLQDALTAATSGDDLWIANGTYKPTLPTAPSEPRTSTFRMKVNVKFYGGFQGLSGPGGGETALNQRNPELNQTILSGDIGSVGVVTDNAYHVLVAGGPSITHTARLDGLTIRDGYAYGPSSEYQIGGGISISNHAQPLVVRCKFLSNQSLSVAAAVSINGGSGYAPPGPQFLNCTFADNNSNYHGGAVVGQFTAMKFINCLAHDNTALKNGSFIFSADSTTYLINCTVVRNASTESGGPEYGAILISGGDTYVVNCIAWANTNSLTGATELAQITDFASTGVIQNCDIQNLSTYAGNGNIGVDPSFVNAAAGNFRLQYLSQLLNNGKTPGTTPTSYDVPADVYDIDNDGNTTEVTPDRDMRPRNVNPSTCVDIGCFENQTAGTCTGDLTNSSGGPPDGVVNSYDLDLVDLYWGSPGGVADLYPAPCGDGVVNIDDYLEVLNHWGSCP